MRKLPGCTCDECIKDRCVASEEREWKALLLRRTGMTFREVGEHLENRVDPTMPVSVERTRQIIRSRKRKNELIAMHVLHRSQYLERDASLRDRSQESRAASGYWCDVLDCLGASR